MSRNGGGMGLSGLVCSIFIVKGKCIAIRFIELKVNFKGREIMDLFGNGGVKSNIKILPDIYFSNQCT